MSNNQRTESFDSKITYGASQGFGTSYQQGTGRTVAETYASQYIPNSNGERYQLPESSLTPKQRRYIMRVISALSCLVAAPVSTATYLMWYDENDDFIDTPEAAITLSLDTVSAIALIATLSTWLALLSADTLDSSNLHSYPHQYDLINLSFVIFLIRSFGLPGAYQFIKITSQVLQAFILKLKSSEPVDHSKVKFQ